MPACEPALALERSICGVSVCVIGIREIFVFEYQTAKISQQLATAVKLRYATLHVSEHLAHVMKRHPHCPPTVPKPFVEASSHTPKASTLVPRGLIKKGRSFPTIGLIFSASLEGRRHCGAAVASCGAMNLIYRSQTLGKDLSRCAGGVLGIGLSGTDLFVCGSPRWKTRQGASRQERETFRSCRQGRHGFGKYPMILFTWIRATFRVESWTSA